MIGPTQVLSDEHKTLRYKKLKSESFYLQEKITKLKSQWKHLGDEEKLVILPWDTLDACLENVVSK